MRKAKVITALSLTVVMLAAMTGLAVATEIDIKPDVDLELVPGSYVKTTVQITEILDPGVARVLIVMGPWGGSLTDLTFYVDDPQTGYPSPESTGGIEYEYTPTVASYNLDVYIKAAAGTEGNTYTLWYVDLSTDKKDMVAATVRGTAIPEFATVAIPMAIAILGGLFFLNHRKRREE